MCSMLAGSQWDAGSIPAGPRYHWILVVIPAVLTTMSCWYEVTAQKPRVMFRIGRARQYTSCNDLQLMMNVLAGTSDVMMSHFWNERRLRNCDMICVNSHLSQYEHPLTKIRDILIKFWKLSCFPRPFYPSHTLRQLNRARDQLNPTKRKFQEQLR